MAMNYGKAATFRERRVISRMEAVRLKDEVEKFLTAHSICALASGDGGFVRNSPVEYFYMNEYIWIFTEGGIRFRALKNNKNVSLAIYEERRDSQLHGMQIQGIAGIVEPFTEEYKKALEYTQIPREAVERTRDGIHLLKIKLLEIDYVNTEFRKEGYDARQHLSLMGKDSKVTVNLMDLASYFNSRPEGWVIFLNVRTGNMVIVPDAGNDIIGYGDVYRKQWEEMKNSDDYARLPGQFELNEYRIMSDFASGYRDPGIRNLLKQIMRRRNPIRRFHNALRDYGIEGEFEECRMGEYVKQAEEWCRENKIPYVRA